MDHNVDAASSELDFLNVNAADVRRWDREWIRYLRKESDSHWLDFSTPDAKALARAEAMGKLDRDALLRARGVASSTVDLWFDGRDLKGKRVVEIGCGTSRLGRDVGLLAQEYIGVDYSELALYIAGLVCPPNCRFVSLRDKASLMALKGSCDVVISRHFFIHQNIDNARWVLRLMSFMLKPGGLATPDFYHPDDKHADRVARGKVVPAETDLKEFASTMFLFEDSQIEELVVEAGFHIEARKQDDRPPRKYFRLVRTEADTPLYKA